MDKEYKMIVHKKKHTIKDNLIKIKQARNKEESHHNKGVSFCLK